MRSPWIQRLATLVLICCAAPASVVAVTEDEADFGFERHDIALGPAGRQTVLPGFFLGGEMADLAVVYAERSGDRRLRIHAGSGNGHSHDLYAWHRWIWQYSCHQCRGRLRHPSGVRARPGRRDFTEQCVGESLLHGCWPAPARDPGIDSRRDPQSRIRRGNLYAPERAGAGRAGAIATGRPLI